MKETTIRQRTLALMKELNIKRVAFADAIGSSRTSLYQWLTDEHRDLPAIMNVPMAFSQVSCEWFFRGKGSMFLTEHQDPTYSVPEDYHNFTTSEATATATASANGSAKATANTSGHASARSTGNASATAETAPAILPTIEGLNKTELLAFLSHKIEDVQKQLAIYNLMIQQTLTNN